VGESLTAAGVAHAFLWDQTHGMRDLLSPRAEESRAWAINDGGQILGKLRDKGGFLWDPNDGLRFATPRMQFRVGEIMDHTGRLVLGRQEWAGGSRVWVWHADTEAVTTLEVGTRRLEPMRLNSAGQVLLRESRSLPFTWWDRILPRWRAKSYLWDPRRGLLCLDSHVPRGSREDFVAQNLNNTGCIVGMLVPRVTNRPRAVVLLEPIPERWEKQRAR